MAYATELIAVSPRYSIWQAYHKTVKAELFSTAIQTADADLIIIDPIETSQRAGRQLQQLGRLSTIVVTNSNHARETRAFAAAHDASIFAPSELVEELPGSHRLSDQLVVHDLLVIAVEGAAPGEFALYDTREDGSLVVGDALINFEPYGFATLPRKYCTNEKQMLRSLRALLDLKFSRIFFAHGTPITTHGHDRLAALLA
jgi:glyoxylase-like metal-dependent hydrolase (beta-lactamase superfamily II)